MGIHCIPPFAPLVVGRAGGTDELTDGFYVYVVVMAPCGV